MARLIRALKLSPFLCSPSPAAILKSGNATWKFTFSTTRTYSSKSRIESNIIRILNNRIAYQSDYAPPHQPETKFNSFTVTDRPGEQWITMRSKFGNSEDIKIEATMFDGGVQVVKPDGGVDMQLHVSLLVDVSRGGEGNDPLEFVISAWPDYLEIQKVYLLGRYGKSVGRPYMGPDFNSMDEKLQKAFIRFLEERGIDDELSGFLHEYMMNKDRTELIQWLGKLKTIMEK